MRKSREGATVWSYNIYWTTVIDVAASTVVVPCNQGSDLLRWLGLAMSNVVRSVAWLTVLLPIADWLVTVSSLYFPVILY